MKISVVSPVYKGENTVKELVKRITDSLKEVSNDYEIILVDDFGPDKSWEIIEEISKK